MSTRCSYMPATVGRLQENKSWAPCNGEEHKQKHSTSVMFICGQLQTLKYETYEIYQISDPPGFRIGWESSEVQQMFSTFSSFLSYFIIVLISPPQPSFN